MDKNRIQKSDACIVFSHCFSYSIDLNLNQWFHSIEKQLRKKYLVKMNHMLTDNFSRYKLLSKWTRKKNFVKITCCFGMSKVLYIIQILIN